MSASSDSPPVNRSRTSSSYPHSNSTIGRMTNAAMPPLPPCLGRERLAIRFLAGQTTLDHLSGSSSAAGVDPGRSRCPPQRASAVLTYVPIPARTTTSSSCHRRRLLPSRLNPNHVSTFQSALTPSLLGPNGRTYHLEVVQHPERSAEHVSAILSRLPLAPPLVVKLMIRDYEGILVKPEEELPFLVAHLTLCAEDGAPLDMHHTGLQSTQNRLLYGTLVSSARTLRNMQGNTETYFIFPDVSVRQRGRYTLKICAMRLPMHTGDDPDAVSGTAVTTLTYVYTRVFDVVSQTNYIAPQFTLLSQLLVRQGVRMYTFESSVRNHESLI